ncbi:Sip2p KNAG_0B00600 [Huiozyma naganishii CBS 8797]|uniref:Association with the SNF1 complex (ASC) domain-containing protein n=1 Tax=Huiozyma naganishii (strain ATCC MYA-139 / BCRC 22969 / CBS 8797 / KCTC 17520 / NBRC 10181 / NCYC 3082 / Yp74L-3) TaxID=1071383 RepID=J7RG51_HUIN7|nr:hypothetical protein KNAG_0B00600 [Kazachstania naganishii CBS 8797]CCK68508.1 hypothetical protein KNAG_0B00600 [Kazachstania naganishii CBS 8797]
MSSRSDTKAAQEDLDDAKLLCLGVNSLMAVPTDEEEAKAIATHGASTGGVPKKLVKRKSTLIFDDEGEEAGNLRGQGKSSASTGRADGMYEGVETISSSSSGDSLTSVEDDTDANKSGKLSTSTSKRHLSIAELSRTTSQISTRKYVDRMVTVDVVWQQGGHKVYVTGSFTAWKKMVGLVDDPDRPGVKHVRLKLPVGTHKFRFVVDNELRFSDFLPTATDQTGNFVNYIEVKPSEETLELEKDIKKMSLRSKLALKIRSEPDNIDNGYTRYHDSTNLALETYKYITKIPVVFRDPKIMEQYYQTVEQNKNKSHMAWLLPPELPSQLERCILNNKNEDTDNGPCELTTPNYVTLNHLLTSSIKNNMLCLGCSVRYRQKYVTQVYYTPLE